MGESFKIKIDAFPSTDKRIVNIVLYAQLMPTEGKDEQKINYIFVYSSLFNDHVKKVRRFYVSYHFRNIC